MSWFKRVKENILTKTEEKNNTPDGLWTKCPNCKKALNSRELKKNAYVCMHCEHHLRIGSEEYFELLFDDNQFREIGENIISGDPLSFVDTKKYPDRLIETVSKTGLTDALRSAVGEINGMPLVISCMDFRFIGGSMGSVVGERIAVAIDEAIRIKAPFMIISKSGGARMMEGALSLMQMAKISAKLTRLAAAKLPYISLLTDPTTGGVTASFAMLGDFNIAEPNSLIGFAGPRVIKETIGRDLPEGFQRSEFVLEHGFLDYIVDRKELKDKLASSFRMLLTPEAAAPAVKE
ncbi:MAG: acetyl-CoA carboxylase, carboxyltransferase subunit beta [Bacteroidia bacterium]|nr:acetyl-CoA carboxylase, carboxyltransferase subunit beta [Bacteroidia bacterium]